MYGVPEHVCYLLGSVDFGFHGVPRWQLEHLVAIDIWAHGDGGMGQLDGYPFFGARGLTENHVVVLDPSSVFSIGFAYHALCRKAPLPLKIDIVVWQLLHDHLPSGIEVIKRHIPW